MPQDPDLELAAQILTDGAGYVDAATIALRYAAVELGPSSGPAAGPTGDPDPVTPERLRAAMGSLVTGVCVVSATWDGDDVAMTANSVTSVSLAPPLMLVCVARSAKFHEAIISSQVWGVSILDASAAEVSSSFARPGRDRKRQFEGLGHHRGATTGVPLLDASCAALECRREAVYPGGDHSIVVGRVVGVEQQREPRHPLVFHRGAYRWLGE